MNRITACLFTLLLIFTFSSLSAQTPKIKNFLPAEVLMKNGIASLYVDGRPVMPMSFCSRNNQDDRYLAALLSAGIKVHFPICDTDWKDPQGFEKLKTLAHRILKLDPQAVLILRLSLDPPRSWMEANLDQCTMFENGSVRMIIDKKFCLASEKWKQRAEEAMTDFVIKVGQSDFGRRVAGYFFTASETEEWYYTVRYDRRYHAHDFSRPMLDYFKDFLLKNPVRILRLLFIIN